MSNVIDDLSGATKRDDVPDFRAGDTIKVHVKVVEGNRSRVQVFQGVVIKLQGSGVGRTFTVRKVSFGVGVERTFPIHSPDLREDRDRHPRRRAPREALLPAQPARQGCQDQGAPRGLSARRSRRWLGSVRDERGRGRRSTRRPAGGPGEKSAKKSAKKPMPLWQETILLLGAGARAGDHHQEPVRPGLLHPVAVDGAAVRQERPDPRAEGLLLGQCVAQPRRHRGLQGPGRLARRGRPDHARLPGHQGDGEDRALPDRWTPGEARHRHRRRPGRVLRRQGPDHRQRQGAGREGLPAQGHGSLADQVRRHGAQGPPVDDGRQPRRSPTTPAATWAVPAAGSSPRTSSWARCSR